MAQIGIRADTVTARHIRQARAFFTGAFFADLSFSCGTGIVALAAVFALCL